MPVGRIHAAVDYLALLGERRLLGEIVGTVEFVEILGDGAARGVLPRAAPDAIARVDSLGAAAVLGAEVGAPGAASGTRRLCQRLAVPVRALKAAESAPFQGPVLVMKKVIGVCWACAGAYRLRDTSARDAQRDKRIIVFMSVLPLIRWDNQPALCATGKTRQESPPSVGAARSRAACNTRTVKVQATV